MQFEVENDSNGVVLECRKKAERERLANRLEATRSSSTSRRTKARARCVRNIHLADGSYFMPLGSIYCKAQTLMIQNGTLLWK